MNLDLGTHTASAVTSSPMPGWLWLAHQIVLPRHGRYEPSHTPTLIYASQLVLELQDEEATPPDSFLYSPFSILLSLQLGECMCTQQHIDLPDMYGFVSHSVCFSRVPNARLLAAQEGHGGSCPSLPWLPQPAGVAEHPDFTDVG